MSTHESIAPLRASSTSASASSSTPNRTGTTTAELIVLDDDDDIVPLPGPLPAQASVAARPPAPRDIRRAEHIPEIVEIVDEHSPPAPSVPRTAATTSAQPPLSTHAHRAPMPPPQLVPGTASTTSASFAAYQSPLGPLGRPPAPRPAPPRAWSTSTSATPFSRASTGDLVITGLLDAPFADMATDLQAQADRLRAAGRLRSSPPARESTPPRVPVAPFEAPPSPKMRVDVQVEERVPTVEVEVKLEHRASGESLRTTAQREARRVLAVASPLPLLSQVERDHLKDEEEAQDEWDAILERRSASAGCSRAGGRKAQRTRKLGPKAIAKREQKGIQWVLDIERF
ncbi:hypothetical protein PsYK624_044490 [Phanerochaete sordida]|uniref:Uncharacterized protein n=1 Tax=Phanerochaete sordida TaxID=48140 RepID=A0A9P3G510_9APHY|nr:hypothetical protein PsYK624_044490 [Phanerochaete sordida]